MVMPKSDAGKGSVYRRVSKQYYKNAEKLFGTTSNIWPRNEDGELIDDPDPTQMKQIPELPNYYITKDGKVWSTISKKWLKPLHEKGGYLRIGCYKNGKRYKKLIHRLVLETYIGPCPEGMEGCHNNGISDDNRLENLRWDIHSNNIKDSINQGTHRTPFKKGIPNKSATGENNKKSKLTESDVRMIIYMWRTGLFKQKEIAKIYNVTRKCISDVVTKKNWKHVWTELCHHCGGKGYLEDIGLKGKPIKIKCMFCKNGWIKSEVEYEENKK